VSARTGDRLDPALFDQLAGTDLRARVTDAILVTTIDDHGRPHPALLACGEIVALSPRRMRLAVRDGSTTARNLGARHAITVCLVDPEGVAYIKAAARRLAPGPWLAARGLAAFELEVQDVLVDAPAPGEPAWLTSGIRFAVEDVERYLQDSADRIHALRQAD
jgi:hypothetical protein